MQSDTPQRHRRWSAWQATLIYGVSLLCLLVVMVWALEDRYHRDLEGAREKTLAHGELVAEWATGAFASTDNTLSGLANLFALSLERRERGDEPLVEAFETLLSQRQQSLPFLDAIGIIGHTGDTLYSTGSPGFPGHDARERAFIRDFLQSDEKTVSAVHWAPEDGDHRMLYLRRMFDAEGRSTGAAAARLDLFFFTHALERIQLGEGESISFIDSDMRLIARRPAVSGYSATEALGMKVEAPAIAEVIAEPNGHSVILTSPLDGDRRIFGVTRLDDLPFAVLVGHTTASVLADWQQKVMVLTLGWLTIAVLGLLILLHYLRLSRTETELHRSEQRLWEINRSLQAELRIADMAFDTHLGMFITDAEGAIQKVNAAFEAITGYSEQEVLGQNPRLLNSGHHDAAFYQEMWSTIHSRGSWQGEVWNRRKNGDTYPQWVTISTVTSDTGRITHYVATLSDMTLRRAAEQEAHRLAFYDPLTGLPNRRMLFDRADRAIRRVRESEAQAALMFIDLDGFRHINDSLGHRQGDEMLQKVAKRLGEISRETDLVARLGGDKFAVLVEALDVAIDEASKGAERVASKVLAALAEPFRLGEDRYQLSGSIGITLLGDGTQSPQECLQQAEMAMYQAKQAGRNALRFFDPVMQAVAMRRAMLESDLRQAVSRGQLRLFYQPQVDERQRITGVEALLRWEHPEHGMVPPGDFIPVAEESYLIVSIGAWVLETACRQLASWSRDPDTAGLSMAVNISPHQFQQSDFVADLEAILARTGARPERLKLELTESVFMEEPEVAKATMHRLRAMGIHFSLDDFGTGYSSLSYLNRLPLDQLKIDQSFVRTLFEDPANRVISASIISLGSNLGLEVIAEGVETQAHQDWLAEHGCKAYQGYLFARPLPIDALTEFLESATCPAGR